MSDIVKMPCPVCGVLYPISERLLGGYVVLRCFHHGRQIVGAGR